MFPAPGMRGKYGADIAIKGAALSGAFLSCDRPNFPGSAAPAYGIAVPLRFWSSWPEVGEGERAALSRRPFTFPHGTRGRLIGSFIFGLRRSFMQSTTTDTRRRATFAVDGYEISATFADSENAAALGQVKQILLSSFASNAPKNRAGGILAIHLEQSDNISGGTPHVP